MLKKNNNDFLNYVIILQESLLKNDSLEKEFLNEDPMNKGYISVNKFKTILKNKLLNIKSGNIDKFINLANNGLDESDNKENEKESKIIHYNNFIKNLYDFRYDRKGNNFVNPNSMINLPKIN